MANPRPMERVLPGVRFDLELVYRVFDVDGDGGSTDARLFDNVLLVALSLVEADALGGGSSRGNGKVVFENLNVDGQPILLQPVTFPSSRSAAG
jgi:CRISPR-associated protein Csm3